MELKRRAERYFTDLQDRICADLEALDGRGKFVEERWSHAPREGSGGGGGRTRVIERGDVFEKGGVNLSAVSGKLGTKLSARMKLEPSGFFASGVSVVLHASSPRVPTVHMNVRYLELDADAPVGDRPRAWFGGGADLTPYFLQEDDAMHFHRTFERACAAHPVADHRRFKRACDEYFYLPHRGEARGVGGIFFDYMAGDLEAVFAFVREVGDGFLEAYRPIVERRRGEPWNERDKAWQLERRGRYVEFNLIHDRGTLFGLETGGRTESILMSLPPAVHWHYGWEARPEPPADSPEGQLLAVLRNPRDWV